MTDSNQLETPAAFVALYVPPGRLKPSIGRAELHQRYEFCEDLSLLLSENARAVIFDLSIAETDVLERMLNGLRAPESGVSPAESGWVIRRLCEHLGWDPGLVDSIDLPIDNEPVAD